MKNMFLLIALLFMSGCMNLYVRCPFTSEKIEKTYQCTEETFVFSYVIMFPQVMAPGPKDSFYLENLITVPIGCLFFIDVACEGIIDTVCLPIDYAISKSRYK